MVGRLNSKLTKARQSKCSNHPPQAVPPRRYMVVDGLGVAGGAGNHVGGAPGPHPWSPPSLSGWNEGWLDLYFVFVFNCICIVIVS